MYTYIIFIDQSNHILILSVSQYKVKQQFYKITPTAKINKPKLQKAFGVTQEAHLSHGQVPL